MILGVIGAGNMGGALIKGFAAGKTENDGIIIFDPDTEKLRDFEGLPGVDAAGSLKELVRDSDYVLIALKPNVFDSVVPQIAAASCDKVYISIAAGISISWLKSTLGEKSRIIRTMPNTPAMVSEGMTALTRSREVTDSEYADVCRIFESLGLVIEVKEEQMHVVTGISGSSPAYTYMYIQALIEKAENEGLDKETARLLAAQSTLGAAKMVLESEESPEQLRRNVCSPGGTTIEAVTSLENTGFTDNIKEAVDACISKSKTMEK